jgi:hypothetical protein
MGASRAAIGARLAAAIEHLLGVARVDLVILKEADPYLALDVVPGELLS